MQSVQEAANCDEDSTCHAQGAWYRAGLSRLSGECIHWIENLITFDPFQWASLHGRTVSGLPNTNADHYFARRSLVESGPIHAVEAQLINPHFICENKIKCRRQSARWHRHGVYWQCNNPFSLQSGAGAATAAGLPVSFDKTFTQRERQIIK